MRDAIKAETLFPNNGYAPPGHYRINDGSKSGHPHPADRMTINVSFGGGAYGTVINPSCFEFGGPEWVMRYGNSESIRFTVASLLETYDYLLSDAINMTEATRRLRIMRAVRRQSGADHA